MLAHLGALKTKAKVESVPCSPLGSSTPILEANREKWVNHFTPRAIIILMKTIKDLYQTLLARAPLPTKDGSTLHTIREAVDYMTGIGKKRELRSQWQRVAKLILAKTDVQIVSRALELALFIDATLDVSKVPAK
jgi:hypothetical protein